MAEIETVEKRERVWAPRDWVQNRPHHLLAVRYLASPNLGALFPSSVLSVPYGLHTEKL